MLEMKPGLLLVRVREREQLALTEQLAEEGDRRRRAVLAEAVGHDHRRIAREIGRRDLVAAAGRRDEDIDVLHHLRPLLDREAARAVRVDVLDRAHEACVAERAAPRALRRHLLHLAGPGEFIERRRRLDAENEVAEVAYL